LRRVTDAERFVHDNEARRSHGEWTDPALGRIRLEQWSAEWFEGAKPTLKPKTAASYESPILSRILSELGASGLSELKPSDVQTWINLMDVSSSRALLAEAVVKAEAITAEQA
jgi:Phage integrase, N-terminal SAM-like domain